MELGQGQSAIAVRQLEPVELRFVSLGAEAVLPQKALEWLLRGGLYMNQNPAYTDCYGTLALT